jgi:tetratricopeptide (TPR) repeat protein
MQSVQSASATTGDVKQAPKVPDALVLLERSIRAREDGRTAEADDLLRQALLVCDHPLDNHNLGVLMVFLNALNSGEGIIVALPSECLARTLIAFNKNNGAEHIEFADFLLELAFIATEEGRRPEAKQHYEQALRIYEKQMGSDHEHTVEIRQEIEKLKQAL